MLGLRKGFLTEELTSTLKLISMREGLQDKTLKWFGHIEKE